MRVAGRVAQPRNQAYEAEGSGAALVSVTVAEMPTEPWIVSPGRIGQEMQRANYRRSAWVKGFLVKWKIDPCAWSDIHFAGLPWESIVVNDRGRGAAHYKSGDKFGKPTAVYPVWEFGQPFELLEELVANPWGLDEGLCRDTSVEPEFRPVLGQPHRVVCAGEGWGHSGLGRRALGMISELQHENPDCVLHVHALASFRLAFGLRFGAASIHVALGKAQLPMGKEIKAQQAMKFAKWVSLLGYKPVDLENPVKRVQYNVESINWASKNWDENFAFKVRRDAVSPAVYSGTPEHGDKFTCDTCSLASTCKYYRDGGVCSLPGAETNVLAKHFRTRDSDQIIEGLGKLLEVQTARLEEGRETEVLMGELQPEVTRILHSLFQNGVKLAKLVDPALNKPGVQVNVGNGGAAAIQSGDVRMLVAAVVRELESQGVPREQITPEVIQKALNPTAPIMADAEVVEEEPF